MAKLLPVCHCLGHVFVVLMSAKSNAIANIFVKSRELCSLPYTILLCHLDFLNDSTKEQRFASLIMVKNRLLSTYNISTVVAFGSEP